MHCINQSASQVSSNLLTRLADGDKTNMEENLINLMLYFTIFFLIGIETIIKKILVFIFFPHRIKAGQQVLKPCHWEMEVPLKAAVSQTQLLHAVDYKAPSTGRVSEWVYEPRNGNMIIGVFAHQYKTNEPKPSTSSLSSMHCTVYEIHSSHFHVALKH